MSNFKPTVKVFGESKFHTNSLVFATIEEAEASARDLHHRWMLVVEHGTEETSDPVNACLDLKTRDLIMLPIGEPA